MCGIAGYAGFDGSARLEEMVAAIRHRGPDDERLVRLGGTAGLGFARLSIVDLSGGHQPFRGETGLVHAVVNGEVYNHSALRAELTALGHVFTSASDGEVVLHGYEQWGRDVCARLEGMFALAVWDEERSTLLLARDRLGKKPLYWSLVDGGIAFASEPKALLPFGRAGRISPTATLMYLTSDSVPTPLSIWSGLRKLEPGALLEWSFSGVREESFWIPRLEPHPERDASAWGAELESRLWDSVSQRLMSDAPLGLFMSSGTDSLTVSAMAARLSPEPLRSFTLTFADSTYDESAAARRAAKCLGTIHEEVPVSTSTLVESFDRFVEIFDEPLNDPASLVMLELAQAASGTIKVALTGDGGDELLMGYPHVLAHSYVERVPRGLRRQLRLVNPLLRAVPSSQGYFSLGFKTQRLARGLGAPDLVARELAWRGAFGLGHAVSLLSPEFRAGIHAQAGLEHFRQVCSGSPLAGDPLDTWSWFNLRSYLLDTVLVKVDRATMAHGVEARSPLLDRSVVELALSIPVAFKRGPWKKKRMLREILHRVAPPVREAHGKHGMGVPVGKLLHGPLKPALMDYSSEAFLVRQGVFDPEAVRALMSGYFGGRQELRKEAWGFLVFQAWFDRWGSRGGGG